MRALLITLAAAALVVVSAPSARGDSAAANTPWPVSAVRAGSLGRYYAAADVAWMKTVQLIGEDDLARHGYPRLDEWVDLDTQLDPSFESAYFFGAILLVTDATRADRVDALLARGEQALPDNFALPMARGFVAYFGRLDPAAAGENYARAASKSGAPPFLARFAEHLKTQQLDCVKMQNDLHEMSSSSSSSAQASALEGKRFAILESCGKGVVRHAAAAYHFSHGPWPSVQDLIDAKAIDAPPPAPRGACWFLDSGVPSLGPCEAR